MSSQKAITYSCSMARISSLAAVISFSEHLGTMTKLPSYHFDVFDARYFIAATNTRIRSIARPRRFPESFGAVPRSSLVELESMEKEKSWKDKN
uniref:Uncharacterized protein n=1 Tax=Romanomermis culicivorax TaxID=13658 RepID=A0A915HX60_ROMCU